MVIQMQFSKLIFHALDESKDERTTFNRNLVIDGQQLKLQDDSWAA